MNDLKIYFNIFGPRQSPESQYAAVIPKFIYALLNQQPLTIHGDGLQTRDFAYVANVVTANIAATQAPVSACGQAYNIGCGERISLLDLVQIMSATLNFTPTLIHTPKRSGDIRDSFADISRAQSWGYSPVIDLKKGLSHTINWSQTRVVSA